MDSHKEARADIICEFLEVSFHIILYIRDIYPHALFQPRRKYNIPVQMCCHPELNQYIRDTLKTVRSLLIMDAIESVVLSIITPEHKTLEKFAFSMQHMKHDISQHSNEDRHLLDIEESLRAALLKINICDTMLTKQLPPNCSFTILLHTTKEAAASLDHDQQAQAFPWIEVDSTEPSEPNTHILPLRTVNTSWINMSIHVELNDTERN